MKKLIQKLFIVLAIFAGINQINAAVTFAITPSAVSNTYNGTITLQIAGITAGSQVVVQKFLDADSNSVVDSKSILWQQFLTSDGAASVFTNGPTSVTNFNIPKDTDGAANGSMTVNLYPAFDFAQLIVAKYFFVLSSPNGQFSPITNSFNVTNFPFAQTLSGNVVNNGTNVPYCSVLLFQPVPGNGENPVWGTVANSSGAYRIAVPPGTYQLAGLKTNFVANLATSPYATLTAGTSIVTNVPLTNATVTISGKVADANSGAGLAGILVPVQTQGQGGLLAVAFTDTNGNFSVGVTSNQWQVQGDSEGLIYKGYLAPQNNNIEVNTTTGSVAGVVESLTAQTAIFYGSVKDSSGNPLAGAEIESSDNNNLYQADGASFTNGNYVVSALGGPGDQWQVQYDQKGPANYIYSQPTFDQNGGTNINAGQAIKVNITGLLATNLITGHVQDSLGNPVTNVNMYASATISGVNYNANANTDNNGNYSINVANGNWNVGVNCNGGDNSLANIYTNGNFQCPNNDSVTINNNNQTANFTVQLSGGQISGYVSDNLGNPIAGVTVSANDGMGDTNNGTTGNNGYYSIDVNNGNWDVSVDCDELNALGYECVADDFVTISDNSAQANFSAQLSTSSAPVFPFTTLHSFSAPAQNNNSLTTNSDGGAPSGGLLLLGNTLYGTAAYGGTNGAGTVFAISTTLTNFTLLHTFSVPAQNNNGIYTNNDGGVPVASLITVSNTLYGTASMGGHAGNGTIFRLGTNGANYTLVHVFAADATNASGTLTNSDGAEPSAALVLSTNTLYSTALNGGSVSDGTMFVITTNGTYTLLHAFGFLANSDTNNGGAIPDSALVLSGNTLYGTASQGGAWGFGTVFAINTNGTSFTVLYCFTNGTDGANPEAGLVLQSNILYGMANSGGGLSHGTVFAINTNGTGFTVLHNFTGGSDGASPQAGLICSNNVLYGTAPSGGDDSQGTVFALNTTNLQFTVLHTFTGGTDGADPLAGLILSSNILYGTASQGGVNGSGTVFALSIVPMALPPALSSMGYTSKHNFQVTVSGQAGQSYTVQMITNILSTNWVSLFVTNAQSASFEFSDTNATNQARFYRVLILQ